jgi:hypothetical protein
MVCFITKINKQTVEVLNPLNRDADFFPAHHINPET